MYDDNLYAQHRLLRELGGMTLAELRVRVSSAELREHIAYWRRLAADREARDG